jgi:hypothetical protein
VCNYGRNEWSRLQTVHGACWQLASWHMESRERTRTVRARGFWGPSMRNFVEFVIALLSLSLVLAYRTDISLPDRYPQRPKHLFLDLHPAAFSPAGRSFLTTHHARLKSQLIRKKKQKVTRKSPTLTSQNSYVAFAHFALHVF